MKNPINYIRDHIEQLWSHITLPRWTDGFGLGLSVGESKAWRAALDLVSQKQADVSAFRATAKNQSTRDAADGMQMGYNMALEAIRAEVKRQGHYVWEDNENVA